MKEIGTKKRTIVARSDICLMQTFHRVIRASNQGGPHVFVRGAFPAPGNAGIVCVQGNPHPPARRRLSAIIFLLRSGYAPSHSFPVDGGHPPT